MSARSTRQLVELFDAKPVVVLEEMQEALGSASRATVFRHLAKVSYRRSYNRNGRYYTKHDPTRYDRHGLFSYRGIHFSRDGNLAFDRIAGWIDRSRHVAGAIVLALDGVVGPDGRLDRKATEMYVPNEFVRDQARRFPSLYYGASINPYRTDALARLERAAICRAWSRLGRKGAPEAGIGSSARAWVEAR